MIKVVRNLNFDERDDEISKRNGNGNKKHMFVVGELRFKQV